MMKKMFGAATALLTTFLLPLSAVYAAQEQPPALDGPRVILQDPLLDKMVGNWKVGGTIRGRTVEQSVEAQWVLNHQFLQIHEKGAPDSKTAGPAYEAMVMIGYDHTSERYVAHWMDIYGGRFSETLGYGVRSGDQIEFVFEYPDGPFRTYVPLATGEEPMAVVDEDKEQSWAVGGVRESDAHARTPTH